MPEPAHFALWVAHLVHAALGLLLIYFVVKITIRVVRGALNSERWRAGYAQGRMMGRSFRYDPDAAAIVGLYVVLHLWSWAGLPTGF